MNVTENHILSYRYLMKTNKLALDNATDSKLQMMSSEDNGCYYENEFELIDPTIYLLLPM